MRWAALLLAISGGLWAAEINLAWDPVTDARVTGYELGWGAESGVYTGSQQAAGTTATLDLAEPGPWYIAARAVGTEDGQPLVSAWSNEVVWLAEAGGPTQPLDQDGLWATLKLTGPATPMSLLINSSDDRIERSSSPLNHNAAYTLMAWVKLNADLNDYGHFFALVSSTWDTYETADWLGTSSDGTTPRAGSFNESGSATTGGSLSVGTWAHVALVRESTTSLKMYLNGSQIGTTITTDVSSRAATQREVYGKLNNNSFWASASIAAIKGWQAALSPTEIAAEMGQYDPSRTSNLVHYVPAYTGTLEEQLTATTGTDLVDYGSVTTDADGPVITAPGAGASANIPTIVFHRSQHGMH